MRTPLLLEIDKENASDGRGSVSDTVSNTKAMCECFTVAIRSLSITNGHLAMTFGPTLNLGKENCSVDGLLIEQKAQYTSLILPRDENGTSVTERVVDSCGIGRHSLIRHQSPSIKCHTVLITAHFGIQLT